MCKSVYWHSDADRAWLRARDAYSRSPEDLHSNEIRGASARELEDERALLSDHAFLAGHAGEKAAQPGSTFPLITEELGNWALVAYRSDGTFAFRWFFDTREYAAKCSGGGG